MYIDILLNLALLVAISVVSGFLGSRWPTSARSGAILQGMMFGCAAVFGMLRPVTLWPGLFFDGRSVVISLCALFFGPWAAVPAAALTIAARVFMGGAGTQTGVLVTLSSAGLGLLMRARFRDNAELPSARSLYVFGLVVHAVMLLMLFAMPYEEALRALSHVGPPVMLLYPLATILAGRILTDQRATARHLQALRESEERLRLALAAANQGLYDLDIQTGAYVLTPEYARMLGFDPATFRETDADWRRRLHPDDVKCVRAYEDCVSGRRGDFRIEFRQRTAGGDWKWILSVGKLVARSADGRPLRLLGIHTDITQRKRGEDALRESAERFELATRATFNTIWDADLTTNALWWNDTFADQFRYAKQDIQPDLAFWAACIHPDERERVMLGFQRALDGADVRWEDEYRFRRGDGTYAIVEDRGIIARDAQGRAVRMIGAMQDVTERKRAEAELHLQSAALNAAANAILITDREGTIVWANPAFTTLTGYSIDESVGHTPRELLNSGVHDRAVFDDLWETLLGGRVWRGELTNRRKDGSRYVEGQTITPVKDARGAITHFIAIKRDLTNQHQLEAQFLQAQKMETVGRLAGGIAHDFNNLLTVINATAELVSAQLHQGDPLRADVEGIREAGERAASLTRQLLAFSRKQIVNPSILDLAAVVGGMQAMLRRLMGEDIDLAVVAPTGGAHVRADAGQIEQVVMNLAVNARDAMPMGGRLTIEIRAVELDDTYVAGHPAAVAGRYVLLAVTDTGAGMDEATQQRIFEPFFTTKAEGQGTGLGLATVYGVVKQNGGQIWVYSEVGMGTTFKVYLPQVNPPDRRDRSEQPKPATRASETVLLVEDEHALRHLSTRVLRSMGYTVIPAASAEEALSLLTLQAPTVHVLLTDVVLPGISGRELASRVTKSYPHIKVLYTSGYTDDAIVRHGLLEMTSHFIAKPYAIEDLKRTLREVLDRPYGH